MSGFERARQRLAELAALPSAEIPLAECALQISACRSPGVDVAQGLARIEALCDALRPHFPGADDLTGSVRALNRHLLHVEGFRGNREDYADVRNSFLDQVLERKIGIPITLCVIYMEVASRLGLDARGISFPGHFLVRVSGAQGIAVIDPFFDGVSLGEDDLMNRMVRFVPNKAQAAVALRHLLLGASKSEIVSRMLRNLREIYSQRGDLEAALEAADQVVMFSPDEPAAVRERGELYDRMEVPHGALVDYRRYLSLLPEAPDAEQIRARVVELEGQPNRLN